MFSYTRLEQLRLGLALTPQEKKVIETRYVAQLWHRFMVTQDLAQKTFILKTLRTMALEGNASAIITFLEQQNGVYDLIHGFDNSDGFELKATLHALDEVACQVGTRHSYLAAAALFEIFATEYRYRNQNDKGFTSFCKRYMSETEAVESTLQEYGETGCFYAATVLLNTYQSEHNADKTAYWNKKLELIPEFLKEKALKYFNLMMINLFTCGRFNLEECNPNFVANLIPLYCNLTGNANNTGAFLSLIFNFMQPENEYAFDAARYLIETIRDKAYPVNRYVTSAVGYDIEFRCCEFILLHAKRCSQHSIVAMAARRMAERSVNKSPVYLQQAHEYGCRKSSAELGCYTWDSEQQQALKYFEHALQAPFDQTAYLTVINFLKPIDLKYYLENLTSLYDLFIKMILAHPNSFIARMTTHPFVIIDTHLTMIDDASLVNEWREARSAFDCDAKIDANDLHDLAARTVSLLQHPVQHKRARR